jgi:hypothetical protein
MAKTPFEASNTLGLRVARRSGAPAAGYANSGKIDGPTSDDTAKAVAIAVKKAVAAVTVDMVREQIARTCHEANRVYCEAGGDDSQPAWEDAPQWQRESALMGVDLHMDNDVGPEASHASWMAQKESDGWEYGKTKNEDKKTHPCMMPFDELPKDQQFKDFLFRAIVHSFK